MIRTRDEGGLRRIVLARPAKANALTAEMLAGLRDAARAAWPASRVILLTGEGAVFSAGADLAEARAGLATSPLWEEASAALAGFPGLTVAALNGPCAGGAMGLMLACDLRVAAPAARFFYPVMRLGFRPQPSDPGRLAALVGPSRARLLLLGGAQVGAEEALRIGLVDRLAGDAEAAARALAADAMGAAPDHLAAVKAMTPPLAPPLRR